MKNLFASARFKFYSTLFVRNCFSLVIIFIIILSLKSGDGDIGLAVIGLGVLIVAYIVNVITGFASFMAYEAKNKDNKEYLYIPILYLLLIFMIPVAILVIPNELDKISDKKNQKLIIRNEIELVNSIKENGVDGCVSLLLKRGNKNENEINDRCIFEYSKYKLDYNICFDIKSVYLKEDCFEYIAKKLKDVSICEYFGKSEYKDIAVSHEMSCILDFIIAEGKNVNNVKDFSSCNNLKDNDNKEVCIRILTTGYR